MIILGQDQQSKRKEIKKIKKCVIKKDKGNN